jgi:hypothetical protein
VSVYLQIGTQTKHVLTSSLFYRHRACLGGWESGQRCLRRLCDEGEAAEVVKRRRWSREHAGRRGSDYAKPNAAVSKTTASDGRTRGGGVIGTLAEANGSVLAAQWGEAAEEHGCDVVGGGVWAEMGGSTCVWWVARMGKSPPRE